MFYRYNIKYCNENKWIIHLFGRDDPLLTLLQRHVKIQDKFLFDLTFEGKDKNNKEIKLSTLVSDLSGIKFKVRSNNKDFELLIY
jgi:hypothetical protein